MSVAELPQGRTVLTGNEAAAVAAVLARVQQIACYPITPQTLIVERLAELVAGRDDIVFANLDSEHSMFGYALASERAGSRCFTATSSQGLLYSHEQLHRASRERIPLVAVNVNRSIVAPWSLEPDLADSMSQRDTGWVQLYCSSGQELLDSILCAYRIAEEAMLPVLVCAEGFLLSHTAEVVDVPSQEAVDAFLPPFRPPEDWLLDPHRPRAFSGLPEPRDYAVYQRNVAEAHERARGLIAEAAADFAAAFGREKVASLELTGDRDANTAIVTIGTIGETARELLRDEAPLLVARVHAYRPFPGAELAAALEDVSHVCVVDRAPAFGAPAPLGEDVRALGVRAVDAVCGLGGTDVTPETLRRALDEARGHAHDVGALYLMEST
jgi:pyruvate/2-oxoacid:ferredoxin oxidoreductase alpha subunit